MRPEDLLAWVRATPFQAFRIVLNSGRSYEIHHPEMLKVGRTSVNIYTYVGGPTEPHDRFEMVSLVPIERVESIDVPAKA